MRARTTTAMKEYIEVMDSLMHDSEFWKNFGPNSAVPEALAKAAGDILAVSAIRELVNTLEEPGRPDQC